MDVFPEGPEQFHEVLAVEPLQVSNRLEAELLQPIPGLWSDAEDLSDGEGLEELDDVVGLDDGQSVRLLEIRCDLRRGLRRRDPDRTGESLLLPDGGLDPPRQVPCAGIASAAPLRHIEVPLLDPCWLEMVCESPEEFHDLAARAAVEFEMRRDEDHLRAAPQRFDRGHRGPDAELSGLVTRGQHDAPRTLARIPAHDDLRVLADLDRRIEGVHVHVKQDAGPRRCGHRSPQSRGTAKRLRRDVSETVGQKPKNPRAASVRKPRKNAARTAVNMTIARAMNTPASIGRGTVSFWAPSSGSKMYMYQMTRA